MATCEKNFKGLLLSQRQSKMLMMILKVIKLYRRSLSKNFLNICNTILSRYFWKILLNSLTFPQPSLPKKVPWLCPDYQNSGPIPMALLSLVFRFLIRTFHNKSQESTYLENVLIKILSRLSADLQSSPA